MKFNQTALLPNARNDLFKTSSIIKQAIINYINLWFDEKTNNYEVLKKLSGNIQLQYKLADFTIENSTKKRLKINRYFQNIKQDLPAIILLDGSTSDNPEGVGTQPYSAIWKDNRQILSFRTEEKTSISLAVGSLDEATTKTISNFLKLIFTNGLKNLAGGSQITSDDPLTPWCITLPSHGITIDSVTNNTISGDNIDSIWSNLITIPNIIFETTYKLELDGSFPKNGIYKKMDKPSLVFDYEKLNLGQEYPISYTPRNPYYRLSVDIDYARIITKNNIKFLVPIKTGFFKLKLVFLGDREKTGTLKIIEQKTLEVE